MARQGKRVLLFDADMGLANVDVMMGIVPRYTLLNVLTGQKTLPEIVVEGPGGIRLVASGSGGVQELADLSDGQREKFLAAIHELQVDSDVILIDTGAGLHRNVMAFVLAAQEVVVVTTPEPTALMDAYGMIKILHREKREPAIRVVVNMAFHQAEADIAGKKLTLLAKRFLGIDVDYLGYVPRDPAMIRAVREQNPVLLSSPASPSGMSLDRLATKLLEGPRRDGEATLAEFFKKVTRFFGGSPKRESGGTEGG
jgi:flagellar biosynthesis protein FlhG